MTSCTGFQWDEWNVLKNREKQRVSALECEQVVFNRPLFAAADGGHADLESRVFLLGQTDTGRRLFIVFTRHNKLIRVIAARPMSRKERRKYESHE